MLLNYARFSSVHGSSDVIDADTLPTIESTRTTLLAQHIFSNGLGLNLSVPAGLVTRTPASSQTTEAIERSNGFGDMTLGVRYDLGAHWRYAPSVALELQLSLPTGKTASEATTTAATPSLISLGSGGYSLGGRVTATQFVGPRVALSANLGVRGQLGPGGSGLTFGDTLTYGVGATILPLDGLTVSADVAGLVAGTTHSELGGELLNTGGHWLAAEVTAGVRVGEGTSLIARGRVPFWQDVYGLQVSETYSLSFGVVLTWTDAEDDDAHDHGDDHDTGDEHDHGVAAGPADVFAAALGGSSFKVEDVVVPGKVTVIDFWATWCAPCTVISRRLKALAATHPDLAVRMVEAPDLDADVVAEHLGGALSLPTVWIYDRNGVRRHALTAATPDAVLEAVKQSLATPK